MSTTLNFNIARLTVDSIEELNQDGTMYIVDFRATGESLNHEINSMFIYENLSQWLSGIGTAARGVYVVNNYDIQRTDLDSSQLVVALPVSNASCSVVDRIKNIPDGVLRVWAGIPHPSIDAYVSNMKMTHNYRYVDFLKYNDKLQQKIFLGDISPQYFKIRNQDDLDSAIALGSGYIKSAIGAGGFSVFKIDGQADEINKKSDEIVGSEGSWYYEKPIKGKPYSVQIYKKGGDYTVFGYAEQYMEGVNYVGAKLIDVHDMSVSLKDFVRTACGRINPFLSAYDGFFGIDIMVNGAELSVLEFNVRLTATTIPTLLANSTGTHEKVEYLEEVPSGVFQKNDIVLTQSSTKDTLCLLRMKDFQKAYVGKSSFIQLIKCKKLPSKLESSHINKIKSIITKNVSAVVGVQVKNFWPYGWTISLILAESHCVMSSCHLQNNIFIDIFCCTDIDTEHLLIDLCSFFDGKVVVSENSERWSL